MSDTGNDTAQANGPAPVFSEREMQMLAWAMQSLKSGAPEIDYEKLAGFAGMSNPRSASNAWAKIKNKLALTTSEGGAPATPKKAGGRKKAAATPKKADVDADADGADGESPVKKTPGKKTPGKRAAKKQDVDGEESPKKKGRASKATKDADEEAAADAKPEVKEETDADADDFQPTVSDEV